MMIGNLLIMKTENRELRKVLFEFKEEFMQ